MREVKTTANGKGAIREPANLPEFFLPKGSPDCFITGLRGFPDFILLLRGQRESRSEGSPDKTMLSRDLPLVCCF